MRKKAMGLQFLVLACLVFTTTFASALSLEGDDWFKLIPSGPVYVRVNAPLSINVVIQNKTQAPQAVHNLQVVVIEPMTGKRVLGPIEVDVNATIPANLSQTAVVDVKIPQAYSNRTLAMVICAVDPGSVVRGSTGWAFVTWPAR